MFFFNFLLRVRDTDERNQARKMPPKRKHNAPADAVQIEVSKMLEPDTKDAARLQSLWLHSPEDVVIGMAGWPSHKKKRPSAAGNDPEG